MTIPITPPINPTGSETIIRKETAAYSYKKSPKQSVTAACMTASNIGAKANRKPEAKVSQEAFLKLLLATDFPLASMTFSDGESFLIR